jgi:hypothetical protein
MTYGPIDYLSFEFQNEKLKGEILPALYDLIEKKIVRVIDLVIVQKNQDGVHRAMEINQLSPDLISVINPLNAEISGLIQVEDINGIAEVMANGTTAAALLVENLWAIQFREAVLRADGKVLEHLRVPAEEVEEAMAKIVSAEAA